MVSCVICFWLFKRSYAIDNFISDDLVLDWLFLRLFCFLFMLFWLLLEFLFLLFLYSRPQLLNTRLQSLEKLCYLLLLSSHSACECDVRQLLIFLRMTTVVLKLVAAYLSWCLLLDNYSMPHYSLTVKNRTQLSQLVPLHFI